MKIKKILVLVLIAALAIPTFQSCKKGENDPFISLKSRKARLKGDWTLVAQQLSGQDGTTMINATYNGSLMSVQYGTNSYTYSYTENITFETDGTFTRTTTEIDGTFIQNSSVKGNWWFGKKNKNAEYKNGEVIISQVTASSTTSGTNVSNETYTGAYCPVFTTVIDQLKSKEMIVLEDGSNASAGNIENMTGTSTYEKK